MQHKKLGKSDMPEIKRTAQHLVSLYGAQTVRASLTEFRGRNVYGCYDDNSTLIGWKVVDKETGAIVSELGKTINNEPAQQHNSVDNGWEQVANQFSDNKRENNERAESAAKRGDIPTAQHHVTENRIGDTTSFHATKQSSEAPEENDGNRRRSARGKSSVPQNMQEYGEAANNDYTPVKQILDKKNDEKDNKKNGKKKHRAMKVFATTLAIVAVAGIGYGAYKVITNVNTQMDQLAKSAEFDYSQYTQASPDAMARITIPSGGTAEDVRLALCQEGMVSCAKDLIPALKDSDNLGNLKQGTYIITGSETGEQFAKRIVSGKLVPTGVIGINDGDTLDTISKEIDEAKTSFNGGDFLNATNAQSIEKYRSKYSMLKDVPNNLPTIEGYIPSGEYNLETFNTADELVDNLLSREQSKYEQSGKTSREWYEILTKASMIDKEALFDEDRSKIASVIDNRLAKGMNLQIDATVKYATKSTDARVLNSDLEVDSPYNTYKNKGLPIGPICSGITQKSIDAVMNHEQTDYLYYVLADKAGHHTFCKTADEFEQARQKYMQIFGYTD